MKRREFVALAGAAAGAAAQTRKVEKRGWLLEAGPDGSILSLRRGPVDLAPAPGVRTPRVAGPAKARFSVDLVEVHGGVALEQKVAIASAAGSGPVRVDLPRLRLPGTAAAFAPLQNGIARRAAAPFSAAYQFAGAHGLNQPAKLALPMLSTAAGDLRLTVATDPLFSAGFGESVSWVYPETVPLPANETRTVHTMLHSGSERSAMDAFYSTALASVPAGPEWLHEVAMVGYDFLSEHGRGWYRDIDALAEMVDRRDRHKVLLALHGWYDYCGRYCFDLKTQSLDRRWKAFPNAQGPEVQQRAELRDNGRNPFYWAPAAIRALRPVEMSLEDLHHRLRYARSRGFRAGLYFADGINACDGIETFDPAKVLRWGGWSGPETKGKSYAMNPLHPEVPRFFRLYLQALLQEFGNDIDALVWDETFYVQGEDLGAGSYLGYAARAMMELVRELTLMTGRHRNGLAFLASDDLGVTPRYQAPYALVAHGTYQDSGCAPKGWPYTLFPNFRNTVWGCSWAPLRAYDRSEYGVDVFDIPVPISNGYGEDLGVGRMSPEQRQKIATLFARRKDRRMDIAWIEERDGACTYKGRPVRTPF